MFIVIYEPLYREKLPNDYQPSPVSNHEQGMTNFVLQNLHVYVIINLLHYIIVLFLPP
jgi:hypothetical protein